VFSGIVIGCLNEELSFNSRSSLFSSRFAGES
jgi:hypothetical protein